MSNEQLNQIDPNSAEAKELIAMALKFKAQQKGKRPEFIQRYITDIVNEMDEPTFENLLYQLEIRAITRNSQGEKSSPIEKIDRVWQVLTYHDNKHRRIQICFETVRNKLSRAKKSIKPK